MSKNKKVVIINGAKGAGKDTFVNLCISVVGEKVMAERTGILKLIPFEVNIHNLSTVDKVKSIATELGWNGYKDDKGRKFLSDINDAWRRYNNGPANDCISKVMNAKDQHSIWFIHCREPETIEYIQQAFNCLKYPCEAIIVRNSVAEHRKSSNHADENVLNYNYSVEIDNNGTMHGLKLSAETFLKSRGFL